MWVRWRNKRLIKHLNPKGQKTKTRWWQQQTEVNAEKQQKRHKTSKHRPQIMKSKGKRARWMKSQVQSQIISVWIQVQSCLLLSNTLWNISPLLIQNPVSEYNNTALFFGFFFFFVLLSHREVILLIAQEIILENCQLLGPYIKHYVWAYGPRYTGLKRDSLWNLSWLDDLQSLFPIFSMQRCCSLSLFTSLWLLYAELQQARLFCYYGSFQW